MPEQDTPATVVAMCTRCGDDDCCNVDAQGACFGGCDEAGSHAVTRDGTVSDWIGFENLRDANASRCMQSFPMCDGWKPADWVTAAVGELGEAANLIKKRRRGEDVATKDIAYEIADTVIYLDLLAARLGIDLGAAIREKFNIVSERVGSEVRL